MKKLVTTLALVATSSTWAQPPALTIDDYMKEASVQNKTLNSYDISAEAARERVLVGDLGLSTLLTASYSESRDKSLPSQLGTERDVNTLMVGLQKKFSTGTTVGLSAQTYKFMYYNTQIPVPYDYSNGQLGISLQQSLWRDSFGRATRLRQSRDRVAAQIETYSNDLKRRGAVITAESDYWDYLVAQESLKLKKANLERTEKLSKWTSSRVSNGISERVDLLQIQALLSLRELELATAQDELEAQAIRVRENLGLRDDQSIPEFTTQLMETRPYIENLKKQGKVVRIENYLNTLDAQLKQTVSEEVIDSQRPDLSVVGKYSTSSYDPDYDKMTSNLSRTDYPVTYVGVNFSWYFGSDALSAQASAAKKDALASQYRAQQSQLESENAWKDFLRKYELSRQNVARLEKISQLQSERTKQEQSMFSRGRSVTLNVVNAETDAAEAQVNYLKAKSALRKLEASALLFTSVTE